MNMETRPPIDPDLTLDKAVDQLKYMFFLFSEGFARVQYALATLAGTGTLDPRVSERLQTDLVDMYEDLYIQTLSFVLDHEKDTTDRPFADEYYTDGRQIIKKFHDPEAESVWEHNSFCCGDGAVAEFPITTRYWLRAPWDHTPTCPDIKDLPTVMTSGGRSVRAPRGVSLDAPVQPTDYARAFAKIRAAREANPWVVDDDLEAAAEAAMLELSNELGNTGPPSSSLPHGIASTEAIAAESD
jgi:hypothetical protein